MLYVTSTTHVTREPQVSVEMIERVGLVLFTIEAVPLVPPHHRVHWRMGDGRKPPLDVALDGQTGQFHELTFFVQDKEIRRVSGTAIDLPGIAGYPVFEVSLWAGGKTYVDQEGAISMSLEGDNLLLRIQTKPTTTSIQAGSISFLIDEESSMAAIALPNLSTSALSTLERAEVIAASG